MNHTKKIELIIKTWDLEFRCKQLREGLSTKEILLLAEVEYIIKNVQTCLYDQLEEKPNNYIFKTSRKR